MLRVVLQPTSPVLVRLILPLGLFIALFLILQRRVRQGDYRETTPKNIKEVDLKTPATSDRIPLEGKLPELYAFLDFKTFEPKPQNFFAAYLVRWQDAGLLEAVDENTLKFTGELKTEDPFAEKFWQVLRKASAGRDTLTVDCFRSVLENDQELTQGVFGGFARQGLDLAVEDGLVTIDTRRMTPKIYLTDRGKEELQNLYAFERYLKTADPESVPLDILTACDRVPQDIPETPAWQTAYNFGFIAHTLNLAFVYRARMQRGGG